MPRTNPNLPPEDRRGPDGPTVEDLKDKAVRGARDVAEKTEATIRSRMEDRRKDAALTLSTVATTLLQSGMHLKDEQALAGEYVERTARQIERAAQYVERADLGEMVDNLETFARRRPALFVGAAFALGLLGARFIKSSRRNIADSRSLGNTQFSDREVPTSRAIEGVSQPVGGAL
ncbi:MAG TPA: hypothetical protein VJ717_09865 [Gemmatimonadaceae bacterium]|nr:hypothetical protein [Gemmatimonadaceae bacterium]